MKHHIKKVESSNQSVLITLENGLVMQISSTPQYINVHFSGSDEGVVVSPFFSMPEDKKLKLSNYFDIEYVPRK